MGNLNLPGWGGKFESELSSMSSENTSGGRQGSGSPGEQGAGGPVRDLYEGRKREQK